MKMRKCGSCKTYIFKEVCPKCSHRTMSPSPPSYSPEDRWGKYRRLSMK